MTKVLSNVMLVLHNVTMESSNAKKKEKREPPNVTKVQSHMMLLLPNVTIVKCDVLVT